MSNSNLSDARVAKNDEFYTLMEDIEKEVGHYKQHLKDKIVYCPCDDPTWSNFYLYFKREFETLGLKLLVSTHYKENGISYKRVFDGENEVDTPLQGDGDFRSEECISILEEVDIVITNPPFSLFREFVSLLMEKEKHFLIIGSMNAITYKNIFALIQQNKLWLGTNTVKEFLQPDGTIKKFGNICWFTNLTHFKRNLPIHLYEKYDPSEYPKYDNYDAIEVSKVVNIPKDYYGVMGVPITFLDKYCPEQFEIIGTQRWFYDKSLGITNGKTLINGKETYDRIFIKRRRVEEE